MEKSEEKDNRGFKVEDRRRFSSEGELKPEHRGSGERQAAEKPASEQPAPPPGATGPATAEHHGGAHAGASAPAEISFASFIVGLSTQVLMNLGEIPDPVTGQPNRDLPGAQQLIDILGMLQQKTRGNLESSEQSLLEAILFDLRMKYVEMARQGPA